VSDLTIRPTTKFLKAGTLLAILVIVAVEVFYFRSWRDDLPTWFPYVPLVILLWPLVRWLQRQSIKAVVTGDRLRYEAGAASRTTRNIQLSKVQDIRVDQGVFERMLNIGSISIETSGETSRLTIPNVDSPQKIAGELMNRSQSGAATA
jgi:uncharacterized membrane protein YdbT with pleckstrin-like domain